MAQVFPKAARVAVAAVFFLNGLLLANWLVRIPDVKDRLGVSEGPLAFALLWSAVGAVIAQPLTGALVAHVGSRKAMVLMGTLCFLFLSGPGWAPTLPLLCVALFLLGAFNGGLDVSMNSQAALIETHYERPIMSSFHGFWSLGAMAGAAVGGFVAHLGFPLGPHLAVGCALAWAAFVVCCRSLIPDHPEPSDLPLFVVPPRALWILGLLGLASLLIEGALADWSTLLLRDEMSAVPKVAALGFAACGAAMAAVRFAGDGLAHRFGPDRVIRVGGALCVLGSVLIVPSPGPWPAIVGMGLMGLGIGCVFPLVLSAASAEPGLRPGLGIAAMATAGYTGFLLGPPMLGGIAEWVGLRASFAVLGALGVLMLLLGGTARRS